jgi:outer membrane protein OmpA-like peptidoglycan-associated protein
MTSFLIESCRVAVVSLLLGSLVGCEHHAASVFPGPATASATPPAPTASETPLKSNLAPAPVILFFAVEPLIVEPGGTAKIKWMVRNAASVLITPDLGNVDSFGEREVVPTRLTEYRLTAKSAGGSAVALAEIALASKDGKPAERSGVSYESPEFGSDVSDIYFDFDSAQLRADSVDRLRQSTPILRALLRVSPSLRITVEGYCDERGSEAYNLALAALRADRVREFLIQAGLSDDRVESIAIGAEVPVCFESTELCWQQNRRVHLAPARY